MARCKIFASVQYLMPWRSGDNSIRALTHMEDDRQDLWIRGLGFVAFSCAAKQIFYLFDKGCQTKDGIPFLPF